MAKFVEDKGNKLCQTANIAISKEPTKLFCHVTADLIAKSYRLMKMFFNDIINKEVCVLRKPINAKSVCFYLLSKLDKRNNDARPVISSENYTEKKKNTRQELK